MSLPAIYNSRFFKADVRSLVVSAEARIAVSAQHEDLCIADISVLPGAAATIPPSGYERDIWMPIAGSLLFSGCGQQQRDIEPGSLLITGTATGDTVIHNPYPDQTINLLRISQHIPTAREPMESSAAVLDLRSKNRLTACGGTATYISAGIYDSRVKDILPAVTPGRRLFFYIVNGAFEVDGRLMEHRDGLALWNIEDEIDFEALSEAAIILVIEY